jgi:tetratricopeptide (TPR) repeat protein
MPPVNEPSHTVFLSYASQDEEAAQKICQALRAGGIEVFLDQSELQSGDAWDQKIRHEIHDCALFIPIISQHTQARLEGYFRHEWNLAIERTHHMAEQKPFLVPVVIDGTRDQEAAVHEGFEKAQADARQALILAPDLAQAHLALASALELGTLDFTQASEAYNRALALAPGNAQVLRLSGLFAAYMGHFDAGLAASHRAVVLDPLADVSHFDLGSALYAARRYEEAVTAYARAISLSPDFNEAYGWRGTAYYGLGDLESARASCEMKPDHWASQRCLAVIYDKLGRHENAETELSKIKAAMGDAAAYQYVTIYAQWGNRAKALEWLETAWRLRDPGLEFLKTDLLLDPLRKEPRFQAIERKLKFPN